MRTYGSNYGSRGLLSKGAFLAAMGGVVMLASGNCDVPSVSVPFVEQRTHYQITVDEYNKLSGQDKLQFMQYSWGQTASADKAQIVGEDLGVKLKDLYQLQKAPSGGLDARLR